MLWVVTFSAFLPSFTSSSLVCATPAPGRAARARAISQTFFMLISRVTGISSHGMKPVRRAAILFLLAVIGWSAPAAAQMSLSGVWLPYRTHEDEQDRGPGPDLGDYL